LETSIGDIVIDLKVDHAPKTCTNFLKLCKIKYYNNCLFHTVQKDYIAQAGDPTNIGNGGTSIYGKLPGKEKFFNDEIHPALRHNVKGTVAMANEKQNENASQFYITLRNKVEHLDDKHTIFGVVAEGLEVLDKMNTTMVDEKDAPYQNIRIWHTEILDDPFDDPTGLDKLIPPKSPEVIKDELFKKVEDAEDEAELQERMAVTLAKSQACTLELLHDLPDADIIPPDSDLFIAKLNPVTQDGDLELIFSRFGPIKSCEIVRDWKTGDSLQYAFITFENVKDCENAYFKMHDCVIDDRRIFVNFSQSVSKLWNKMRTGGKITSADIAEANQTKGKKGGGKGKGKGAGPAPVFAAKDEPQRGKSGNDSKHGFVGMGDDKRRDSGGRSGGGAPKRERSRSRERSRDRDRDRARNDRDRNRKR